MPVRRHAAGVSIHTSGVSGDNPNYRMKQDYSIAGQRGGDAPLPSRSLFCWYRASDCFVDLGAHESTNTNEQTVADPVDRCVHDAVARASE